MKLDFTKAKAGVVVAGHRGDPACFPENTMSSFRSAYKKGVDMIETDIHVTKDGALVLMHDHSALRTAGVDRLIRDMTFEEVRALNVGTETVPEKVPTLEELLAFAAPKAPLTLDLEIKVYLEDEGAARVAYAVDETVKLCEKYGMTDRVMFNCFDAYVLEYLRDTYGGAFTLHGYYPYSYMKNVNKDPKDILDIACYWKKHSDPKESTDFLKRIGVLSCTGNTTEEEFREAVALGVSMVTVNDPAEAIARREKL